MQRFELTGLRRNVLLCAALVSASACTRPGGDNPPGDGDQTKFAEVVPDGTGCPGGTTHTSVSSDGLVFTTTFSAYETQVLPGEAESAKECGFAIRVHTPSGRSTAVQTFSYSGVAWLTEGVSGTLKTSYRFGGVPVAPRTPARAALVGPYDRDFVLTDDVPISDAVWSPCGVDREVKVTAGITLQNPGLQGEGYLNISAFDGSSKLEVRLMSRPCNAP